MTLGDLTSKPTPPLVPARMRRLDMAIAMALHCDTNQGRRRPQPDPTAAAAVPTAEQEAFGEWLEAQAATDTEKA